MARLYYLTEKQKEEAEFHQDMLFRILKKMIHAPTRTETTINAAVHALERAKVEIQKLKDEKGKLRRVGTRRGTRRGRGHTALR